MYMNCFVGPITVFIPSNAAFEKLPDEEKDNLNDTSYVKQILLYHVIKGHHLKDSFHSETTYKSESILEGDDKPMKIRINMYNNGQVRMSVLIAILYGGLVGLWCFTPLSTTFQLYRRSVLLVEKTGIPRENHRHVESN